MRNIKNNSCSPLSDAGKSHFLAQKSRPLWRWLLRWPPLGLLTLALAACSSPPPQPDWQSGTHDAARRASRAALVGQARIAAQEWTLARRELAGTGSPALLARLELLRCAVQLASLEGGDCPAFELLRADAAAPERAYADYLAGRLAAADLALLPQAQRAAAAAPAGARDSAIAAIADPLARLVAAGAALQAGQATPQTLVLASDTASAQGWGHALQAWLLARQQRAQAAGEQALVQALQRRIDLIRSAGQPLPAPPARPGRAAANRAEQPPD